MSYADSKAIVKLTNYAKGKAQSGRIKTAIRYAAHRGDEQGHRQSRSLYDGSQELAVNEAEARLLKAHERMSAEGREPYVYHVVINPGAGRSTGGEEAVREYARGVMSEIAASHYERSGGRCEWVAVTHNDHTEHDHIHAVVVTDRYVKESSLEGARLAGRSAWQEIEAEQEVMREVEQQTQVRVMTPEVTREYDLHEQGRGRGV